MKRTWQLIVIALIGFICSLSFGYQVSSQTKTINLVQEAQQYYQQGKFQFSLELLTQANQEFVTENKILQQAQTQSLISFNQQQLGNWKQAQQAIDYGLALIATEPETSNKQQVLGQIWNAQANLFQRKGEAEKAIKSWLKAEQYYKQINDNLGIKGIVIGRTQALESLGFYRRSCNSLLELFSTENKDCQQLDNEQLTTVLNSGVKQPSLVEIEALSSLANNFMLLGKLDQARQTIEQSKNLFKQIKESSLLLENKISFTDANIAQAKANLAQERKNIREFKEEQKKAIALYQEILARTNSELIIDHLEAKINLLDIYARSQKWQLAQEIIQQNELNPPNLPLNYRTLKSKLTLARNLTYLKENKLALPQSWSEISQLYIQIRQEAHQLKNARIESYAVGFLGELASQQQLNLNLDPQQLIERALQLAQANQAPEIAYRWQWQLGKLYRDRGEIESALIAYQAAFASLQDLRSDLVALDREIQFSFRQQVEPVYREYAKLLLVEQNPQQINTPANLQKARDVIEALQVAELDNYFQDACITSQKRNIEDIDSKAAVIYTIVLPAKEANSPDRLEVILSLPDGSFHHYGSIVDDSQLFETIQALNNYLLQPDRLYDINDLAHHVYNWLIEPAETILNQSSNKIQTLVFVLDGNLQNLPMSALYDGKQYLIEKYAIAITPGLRLLNTSTSSTQLTALTGGLTQQRATFPPLQNVKVELTKINSIIKSKNLLDSQFTSDNLTQAINNQSFSIVHLATHGQFSSNPEETFIMLWDRRLTLEDFSYLLQNRDFKNISLIDLLVLSACETAKGDDRATLGLAGMTVRTGVSTTLATLWQVSDRSTAIVMDRFYQYLSQNPKITKAEALRRAQLDLWQNKQQDWEVPLFWAAYVLVGNWL